jgi:PhzF family phenazine biosynthesis protein
MPSSAEWSRSVSVRRAFAIVDAFATEQPFSGNPAGVLLLDEFPATSWLQGVANELQQAETAFLAPGEEGVFLLRWFTPVAEVALCGHATLASAHWLWESGFLEEDAVAAFATRSGRLTAMRDDDRVVLDFPAVPAVEVASSPELLAALTGAVPVWAGVTDNADPGERNMLAVLESEDAVRDLSPDLQEIARLPVGGLIVTAKRRAGGVVSRYFAPAYGIPEDPVTGSAHCTIGPYWRDELGTTLSAEQASPRRGELSVVTTDAGRVLLAGKARTAATGFIL